jgi:hypothetical protein
VARLLRQLGAYPQQASRLASSGKGWWRMALSPQASQAMSADWCRSQGIIPLVVKYDELTMIETAAYDKYVRWCGRTGPRGPSYPILAFFRSLLEWQPTPSRLSWSVAVCASAPLPTLGSTTS